MKFPFTKKRVFNKLRWDRVTIYGRLEKNSQYIKDLFNPKISYRTIPTSQETQGWMDLKLNKSSYIIVNKIYHDIVYVNKLISDNCYSIYIIRKWNSNPKLMTTDEYFYNIQKEEVLGKIGVNYNGYIYYNSILDKDQRILNEFRNIYKDN